MSPKRIEELAGLVFAGTVTALKPERAGGTILTRVVFHSLSLAKGKWDPDSLELVLEGGQVGGELITIDDQPTFDVGHRYIVFALADRGSRANSYMPVVGLTQGLFTVHGKGPARDRKVSDAAGRPITRLTGEQVTVVVPDSMIPKRIRDRLDSRARADSARWARRPPGMRPQPSVLREREDPGTRISEEEFLNAVRGFSK